MTIATVSIYEFKHTKEYLCKKNSKNFMSILMLLLICLLIKSSGLCLCFFFFFKWAVFTFQLFLCCYIHLQDSSNGSNQLYIPTKKKSKSLWVSAVISHFLENAIQL